jgi:hypothetical protein
MLLNIGSGSFDEFPVMNAGRTRSLTGTATKAEVQVTNDFRIERKPPLLQCP